MRTNIIKYLTVLAVFLLLFSMSFVPFVNVSATDISVLDGGKCGENLNWELTSDGVLRIFGTGAMYDYNKYYEPAPWYKYREEPYISEDGKAILDSNGDVYLSTTAYYQDNPNGYKVKSIVIEEGITYIGDWAFYRVCVDEITVPEGVEATGIFCFRYSPTLKILNLPDSLKILDDFAISRNYLLHTLNIGNGLEKVGTAGFNRNPSLKSIILPDTCTSVNVQMSPAYANIDYNSVGLMENCSSLKTVKLGRIDKVPQRTCLGADIETIIIPNTVKSIDSYAFYDCKSLKNVVFEENSVCTTVADNAFLSCVSLESVTGGTALETLGSYTSLTTLKEFTFSSSNKKLINNQFIYTSLKSVSVSENITTIPVSCFNSMYCLERIYLPSSLQEIKGSSFNYCTSLKRIYYNGTLEQWQAINKASGWSYKVNPECIVCLNDGTFATVSGNRINSENIKLTVEFKDYDGTLLGSQEVGYGNSAILPDAPQRVGYIFNGWDKDVSCITNDITVTATYLRKEIDNAAGYNFLGTTVTLGGNIAVNLYMDLSEEVINDATAKLVFRLPNGNYKYYYAKDAVKTGEFYVFSCEVTAKEMASSVKAQLVTSTNKSEVFECSVKEYSEYILLSDDSRYENAKPLVRAMLNYGAYAQLYFGYNTEKLANESLSDTEKTLTAADLSGYKYLLTGNESGVSYYGSRLSLESETTIKHYFSIEDEDNIPTITVNDVEVNAKKKNGYYEVKVPDILPQNLDKVYRVTVGDLTLEYSPLSYGYSAMNGNDQELKNVIRALFAYNKVAETYIGTN